MGHVVSVLADVLVGLLVARILVGWSRWRPWRPTGDSLLVEVMRTHPSHRPGAVCCAVVDETSPDQVVRQAYARCDASTRFEIGSVTKTFTGLLLADAFQRRELAPSTTLGEVWPDLAAAPAGGVTMDELAHHTSGLPNAPLGPASPVRKLSAGYLGADPYRGLSPHHVHGLLAGARLRDRGRLHYSNLGAAAVGLAVTARAGAADFAALLDGRLLEPLGLEHTSGRIHAPRPAGHGLLGAWSAPWRTGCYAPAGGMTSTLDDMTRYARLLLAGRVPGQQALSDGLFWQCFTTPQGRHRYWHDGQTGGYSAYFAVYPEAQRAVIVLAAHANADDQARLADACVRTLNRPSGPTPTGINDPA